MIFEEDVVDVRIIDVRITMMGSSWFVDLSQRGTPRGLGMEHSLKGAMDLMHYNRRPEKDLKQIYDRVMIVPKIMNRKY
jgi:hypothetical protein